MFGVRGGLAKRTLRIALVGAIGGAMWTIRWLIEPIHAFPDTFWYTRMAFQDAGATASNATIAAAGAMVGWRGSGSLDGYVHTVAAVDPRYAAIFEARPMYPLVAAPFIPILGPDAMVAASLLAGVVATVGIFVALVAVRGSWLALLGGVLAFW